MSINVGLLRHCFLLIIYLKTIAIAITLRRKTMNNLIIRKALAQYKLKQWQVAKIIGVGESTLTRRMREEMSMETQQSIVDEIKKHAEKLSNDIHQDSGNANTL